jgi:hypothetical protein
LGRKSSLWREPEAALRAEFLGRGGQQGEVLWTDDKGVSLDFYCDRDGNPGEVPSQEFWE